MRRRELDSRLLIMVTLALVAFGLVMVYSATSAAAAIGGNDPSYYLKRQGIYAALGIVLMIVVQRWDYRRLRQLAPALVLASLGLLVATGVLLGFVLLVMVGETIQELQLAGWLPTTSVGVTFPGFVNLWFATFPTVEGLAAQAVAAALVIGSYFLAEHVRVRAPRARAARQPAASQSS